MPRVRRPPPVSPALWVDGAQRRVECHSALPKSSKPMSLLLRKAVSTFFPLTTPLACVSHNNPAYPYLAPDIALYGSL